MLLIYDRVTNGFGFKILELLESVSDAFGLGPNEQLHVTKIGGVGPRVWHYESQIDDGKEVKMSMRDLLDVIEDDTTTIDELECANPVVTFGISDAAFMFVQGVVKASEEAVGRRFAQTKVIDDR
jgi:hypothetical protein